MFSTSTYVVGVALIGSMPVTFHTSLNFRRHEWKSLNERHNGPYDVIIMPSSTYCLHTLQLARHSCSTVLCSSQLIQPAIYTQCRRALILLHICVCYIVYALYVYVIRLLFCLVRGRILENNSRFLGILVSLGVFFSYISAADRGNILEDDNSTKKETFARKTDK